MAAAARDVEIEKNYQFFQSCVASMLPHDGGKFAVIHNQKVVGIYAALVEAVAAGHSQFDDNLFSIQEVTDAPMDLGFFSHANSDGRVR